MTNCGTINEEYINKKVELYGWCRYIRDHGGKLFIDIADKHGITQLVFEKEIKKEAEKLGRESVIHINGEVKKREEETVDKRTHTGTVEVYVNSLELISTSLTLPFELVEQKKKFLANEELRLKYRYMDLRREEMIHNMKFRDKLTKSIRKYFWDKDFMELETPTLIKDTYETGSRTFLVPSRTKKGSFYSLPQSPQMYKQMCMIGGLEKYFQIAKCYRDEDPREDRQPEFTQIDIEASFIDEKYIKDLIEEMFVHIFKDMLNTDLKIPFANLTYKNAMEIYGSEKPDLRYESKIIDITDIMAGTEYNVIKRVVDNNGKVKILSFDAKYGEDKSKINKNYMLKIIEIAKILGLRGLTWLFVKDNTIHSDPETIAESLRGTERIIRERLGTKNGDLIIMGADLSESLLLNSLGRIRKEICDHIGNPKIPFAFIWITDFPLFEKDEVTGKLSPSHNPFTSPLKEHYSLLDTDPENVIGRQYDIVLNGWEIGGGSIRITDPKIQRKIFEIIGVQKENINNTFGFILNALSYGTPIHGGIALGLDRTIVLLNKTDNIRDFILFPKNKKFELLMDGSPTKINKKRLKDDFNIEIKDLK